MYERERGGHRVRQEKEMPAGLRSVHLRGAVTVAPKCFSFKQSTERKMIFDYFSLHT